MSVFAEHPDFVSGLYCGVVSHFRFKPKSHRLSYRIFMLLLDLDELEQVDWRLGLFSLAGFNLLSFDPRRHGDGSAQPLKAQIEARLACARIATGGPIRMLTMPRILGHSFNPLTVYFCHAQDGRLSAMLYEVNNTFGERHSYLIPAHPDRGGMVRQSCAKEFYVSPFMDMDLEYAFRLRPPGETVLTAIDVRDDKDLVLAANFIGRRTELSDWALLKAWLTHPWMTVGVLAAIHIEALRMWLKGEKVRDRTPAPAPGLTVVTPAARLAA
ncbi:MAG: DUF1365 domain-containing protein [Phenylobacterium sp.]|nr:MAG: DUF1365 domain-containing protein [Phenylobacterium sp.]